MAGHSCRVGRTGNDSLVWAHHSRRIVLSTSVGYLSTSFLFCLLTSYSGPAAPLARPSYKAGAGGGGGFCSQATRLHIRHQVAGACFKGSRGQATRLCKLQQQAPRAAKSKQQDLAAAACVGPRVCVGPRPVNGPPHLVSLGTTPPSVPPYRFPLPVESRGQRPRACVGPSGYCRLLPSSLSTNALLVLPTLQPCFRLYSLNLSYMYEVSSERLVFYSSRVPE